MFIPVAVAYYFLAFSERKRQGEREWEKGETGMGVYKSLIEVHFIIKLFCLWSSPNILQVYSLFRNSS